MPIHIFETKKEFVKEHADMIGERNLVIARYFPIIGLLTSGINIFAERVIVNSRAVGTSTLLFFYFLIVFILMKFLRIDRKKGTLLLYLLLVPPFMITILNGTVYDPSHQALSFLMYLVFLPVCILDLPIRVFSFVGFWTVVFLGLVFTVKDPSTHRPDFLHAMQFMFTSLGACALVLEARFEGLRTHIQTVNHAEHDELTGMKNRYSLNVHSDKYMNQDLNVLLINMNDFRFFNDLYGHEKGDQILIEYTTCITNAFKQDDCYRYDGGEILIISTRSTEDCIHTFEKARKSVKTIRFKDIQLHPECVCGYVTGRASTRDELDEMVRLASIRAFEAQNHRKTHIIGGMIEKEMLRHEMLTSEMSSSAWNEVETDPLTGLLNMQYFLAKSQSILDNIIDMKNEPVIAYFNILDLKKFNAKYGYTQGDALLQYVAELLQESFPNRTIARFSDDHFVALLYRDELIEHIDHIYEDVMHYKNYGNIQMLAGAYACQTNDEIREICDYAKIACDQGKHSFEQKLCWYDDDLKQMLDEKHYILDHLDEAIEQGYIHTYYQPVVRTMSDQICSEEALARWIDPEKGVILPATFVPILEEAHLIYRIDLQMIKNIIRDFKIREEIGMSMTPVSVNLSRSDFSSCDIVSEIITLMDEAGITHDRLIIEITESALVSNRYLLKKQMERLHQAGFKVWMDDFGSGYSSLNFLQEFDFDLIKFDMNFMKDFETNDKNRLILTDMIDMVKKLGVGTLVEGVETDQQFIMLRNIGCERIQGDLFSQANSLEYIIQRFEAGTGLRFEEHSRSAYYEIISKIDLHDSFGSVFQFDATYSSKYVPSGVIEYKNGYIRPIRANEAFLDYLESTGMDVNKNSRSLVRSTPSQLKSEIMVIIRECIRNDEWKSTQTETNGKKYTVYVHHIVDDPQQGSSAILVVVLPVSK